MTLSVFRAIHTAVSPHSLIFRRSRASFCCSVNRPSSSSSAVSATPVSTVRIPLFLREATGTATISELHAWRKWAQTLVSSVGSKFEDADNGPGPELLCREIRWMLEDVVEANLDVVNRLSDETAFGKDGDVVRLRAGLDELYCLWEERIEKRRPFQYLVGCDHWRDLVVCVQEGVLIPRPETEMIVDMVEEVVSRDKRLAEGIWADLGTGSGALGIGIARILRNGGKVVATDISEVAISVASFNVNRYGLQDKIELRQGSWFEPLEDVKGKLSGLVSNPPYIPSMNIAGLQAEVGQHEPRLALDGGKDGLDYLLHLCENSALALESGGFFAFETNGGSQSKFIADVMTNRSNFSFRDVKIVADLSGIQRFVTGFRQ
ncbi:hypothetical protein H6P81_019296 [Aristolochia fimbriata]|uniref:Uncharacterized protein n=1 Tax=Aristolochia fimbriata TaxID=158543 RepID=A0AAV7DSG1_ARIFI|nr:hypothetical protein H6P81_019296 [Aristolochia fimbriata]